MAILILSLDTTIQVNIYMCLEFPRSATYFHSFFIRGYMHLSSSTNYEIESGDVGT